MTSFAHPSTVQTLTQIVPTLLGAVLLLFAVIALGIILKAYADAAARRISPRRIVVDPKPRDDEPAALPVLLLVLVVIVIAAKAMGISF